MADPGSTETVLVVGDGDPSPSLSAVSPSSALTPATPVGTSLLVDAIVPAAMRARTPTTQTLAPQTPSSGASQGASTPDAVIAPTPSIPVATALAPLPVVSPALAQVVVVPPPVGATLATLAPLSPPVTLTTVTTPAVQVSVSVPAAQVTAPAPTITVATSLTGLQASLSSPIVTASAGVVTGRGVVSGLASTLLGGATLSVDPVKGGLRAMVTSPASTLVSATLASSVAPIQTSLAGVSTATGLAAPSAGTATPTAIVLMTLKGLGGKKLKRG